MPKPQNLKGQTKHDAIDGDRHNPTMPQNSAERWARELTTTRVADLFRTERGLPGHWEQIQAAVNAGNHHFYNRTDFGGGFNNGGKTSDEGKLLIRWISDAIIASANAANFDFSMMLLKFTMDTGWLKISRVRGRVILNSRP